MYKLTHKVRDISAVKVYFQIGEGSMENSILSDLLAEIIHDSCFNILRTKSVCVALISRYLNSFYFYFVVIIENNLDTWSTALLLVHMELLD